MQHNLEEQEAIKKGEAVDAQEKVDAQTRGTSSCCDAQIILGDLCKSCGEHCTAE